MGTLVVFRVDLTWNYPYRCNISLLSYGSSEETMRYQAAKNINVRDKHTQSE